MAGYVYGTWEGTVHKGEETEQRGTDGTGDSEVKENNR